MVTTGEYKATGFQEVKAVAPYLAPTMNTMDKEAKYGLISCGGIRVR